MEILHTILLVPIKYLVKKTMTSLSPADKKKVKAKIDAFDFLAYERRLPSSFVTIYGSCVGRDFKLWAQISVFILDGIICEDELEVWLYISEVICLSFNTLFARDVGSRGGGKLFGGENTFHAIILRNIL